MDEANVLNGWLFFVFFTLTYSLSTKQIYSEGSSVFQKAYEVEKTSTLLSIPLYENSLMRPDSPKGEKAAVGRLFILYKKHKKWVEALFLGSRYSKFIAKKDRDIVWESIGSLYEGATISELQTAYQLVFASKPNQFDELQSFLLQNQKKSILDFVLLIIYRKKEFELGIQLLNSDPTFVGKSLYEGMYWQKSNSDEFRIFLEKELKRGSGSDSFQSDTSFLLGYFFRSKGEWEHSARFFRMSSRGKLESAKSLFAGGYKEETCKAIPLSQNTNEEWVLLLYHYCSSNGKEFLDIVQPSLQILAKREGKDLYSKFREEDSQ